MRAGVLWMVMVCLSDGEVNSCSVQQIVTVSKPSKVTVSCPSIMADSSEVEYMLLFNDSCISQIHLENNSTKSLFSGQFEVTASNNGVYVCTRVVIYPPPFNEDCHTTEVKVDGKMHKQKPTAINATGPAANQSCPDRSPFIPEVVMWAVCAVLLVYGLSFTCVTAVIWRKLKKDDEDTRVYANTRAPAERKKTCKA